MCDYHHYSLEEEERLTSMVTTTGVQAQGEGCHYDTTTKMTYGHDHAGSTTGEVASQENNDIVWLHHQTDWQTTSVEIKTFHSICIKLSENDLQIRDKFATILRTLPLMYETKYRQFCANLALNLRQICATPPFWTPPSGDFWQTGHFLVFAMENLDNKSETPLCSNNSVCSQFLES